MAYYLRKEKKKKGTYLQMYESHWDKEKKQPRSKSVMAFGYVHDLIANGIPDPVAYYTDFVATKSALLILRRKPVPALLLPLWNTISDISSSIHF